MKIRNGFVSNSSSSSFICEVCGNYVGGYDMSVSEAGMVQCNCGHIICISHLKDNKVYDKAIELYFKKNIYIPMINDLKENYDNNIENIEKDFYKEDCINIIKAHDEDNYDKKEDLCNEADFEDNFPSEFCPICQLEVIPPDNELIDYLIIKKIIHNRAEILEWMKNDREANKIKQLLEEEK